MRMNVTSLPRRRSTVPRYVAMIMTSSTTNPVSPAVTFFAGQTIFRNSALTSLTNVRIFDGDQENACSFWTVSDLATCFAFMPFDFFFATIFFVVCLPPISCILIMLDDGRPGGIRTPNPRIWSPVLYQFELLASSTISSLYAKYASYKKNKTFSFQAYAEWCACFLLLYNFAACTLGKPA